MALGGTIVGRISSWDPDAGLSVDYPGLAEGPVLARSLVVVSPAAVEAQAEVLLSLTDAGPVIVGLLVPTGDELANPSATVDDDCMTLTGKRQVTLKCGDASITLRENGRVVIRGAYVETRSSGVNRIKGGTVKIN